MYQIPNCLLLTWERVVMKSVIDPTAKFKDIYRNAKIPNTQIK